MRLFRSGQKRRPAEQLGYNPFSFTPKRWEEWKAKASEAEKDQALDRAYKSRKRMVES